MDAIWQINILGHDQKFHVHQNQLNIRQAEDFKAS
jgi:hypothetical protein